MPGSHLHVGQVCRFQRTRLIWERRFQPSYSAITWYIRSQSVMILITGAGGKTGRAVMRALISKGEPVRALVHRSDQIQRVDSLGVREVLAGDMNSASKMDRAVRGVRAIYHICPNVSPDEVSIGQTAIAAARAAGIEHFVYHSVLHP